MILLSCLAIVATVLVTLYPTRLYWYVTDDIVVMSKTPDDRAKWKWWYRLWLQYRGRGYYSNIESHWQVIIQHAIVCALIYLALGRDLTSFLCAMIFAVHPGNHQGSVWLSAKHYVFGTIIVLLGFVFIPLAPVFAPLGFVAHGYNAFLSPLMFLFTPYWYMAIGMMVMYYIYYRHILFGTKTIEKGKETQTKKGYYSRNKEALSINPWKLVVALKYYGYYLTTLFSGTHNAFYHGYMNDFLVNKQGVKKSHQIDGYFIVGLLAAISSLMIIPEAIHNQFGWAWGLWWFNINVAMWLNVVTWQEHLGSRFAYLANIGLCLVIANLGVAIAVPAFAWYLSTFRTSMKMYTNDFWFTVYQTQMEPKYAYSWIQHGNLQFMRKNFTYAMHNYNEALLWDPLSLKAKFNLTSVCVAISDIPNAWKFFYECYDIQSFGQDEEKSALLLERKKLLEFVENAIKNNKVLTLQIQDIPILI